MRNEANWRPSKYVYKRGRLRATRDKTELNVASRLIADLVAELYESALKVHARGRLLDMGCGKAPLFATYRPQVSDIQCIDWDNGLHGADYLDKSCDLNAAMPYADETFDTIILSDVLEHLPEPARCWTEIGRLLAPGGKMLLNVPFYYQVHEAPFDFYRYTEFALRRFAEQTGFEICELKPIGGPIEILADLAAKLCAAMRLNAVAGALQSASFRFAKSGIGSRISKKMSERFPLGYFMVVAKPGRAKRQ